MPTVIEIPMTYTARIVPGGSGVERDISVLRMLPVMLADVDAAAAPIAAVVLDADSLTSDYRFHEGTLLRPFPKAPFGISIHNEVGRGYYITDTHTGTAPSTAEIPEIAEAWILKAMRNSRTGMCGTPWPFGALADRVDAASEVCSNLNFLHNLPS